MHFKKSAINALILCAALLSGIYCNTASAQDSPADSSGEVSTKAKSKSDKSKTKSKSKSKAGKNNSTTPATTPESSESTVDETAQNKDVPVKFKKIGLGLNAGFVYLGGGGGLEGWYSPSKKLDLSLRILRASSKMKASGDANLLETASVTMLQLGAHARYFFGKSFFVLGGLGYNLYNGSYGYSTPDGAEYLLPMTAKAISIDVALGNMWKWDGGFSLGFDWVGYSSFSGMTAKVTATTPDEEAIITRLKTAQGGGDPNKKSAELLLRQNIYFLLVTAGYRF